MKQWIIIAFVVCVLFFSNGKFSHIQWCLNEWIKNKNVDFFFVVYGDVSSLDGVKTFPSTTSSTSPENSNSFSILTKEFLNKPDGDVSKRNSLGGRGNPSVRINGIDNSNNKLAETDDSDERQAYYYDKPKIPFDLPDSSNIQINTVPPKKYALLISIDSSRVLNVINY